MLNIFSQLINNFLISTCEDVVGPVGLVGGDEVLVESSGERDDGLELSLELPNEIRLEDSGALARLVQILLRDVPARDHEVHGVHQWNQVLHGLVHIMQLPSLVIEPKSNVASGALSEGAVEVGVLHSVLGLP